MEKNIENSTYPKWRIVISIIVNSIILIYLLLFTGGMQGLLSPFTPGVENVGEGFHAEIHRWHEAQMGAMMGILVAGPLVILLWRPQQKVLVMKFYVLFLMLVGIGILSFSIHKSDILMIIPGFLALLSFPGVKAVFSRIKENYNHFNKSILIVTILAAILLLPEIWASLAYQIEGNSEHAMLTHGMISAVLYIGLIFLGFFAASNLPGSTSLSILVAICYLYLGIVAFMLTDQPGSWGYMGGSLGLLAAVIYLFLPFYYRKTLKQTNLDQTQ